MAPGLRTNVQGRTRGANRGEQHDDFEGLPIRQWRKERHNIAPPSQEEQPKHNDKWAVELPNGMPKDSHLLPQHSQDLLRALRSGRFYKRPAPDDEEAEQENIPEKPEKKEEEEANIRAFAAPIWRPIPRNAEGPEISHLAKRRKGTVVLPSKAALLQSGLPTVTKAKVRRLDAAGNSYIQDVTLSDGQPVDGEIISTSVVTAPVAMNATSGDISAQTTPVKRKPVAQRKKIKGPGRGRKKKLPLPAPTRPDASNGGDVTPTATEGVASAPESNNGTKVESENPSTHDSPMVDEDDGDDDEGDDNEGVEDEHDQDHEMKDAPLVVARSPTRQPEVKADVAPEPVNASGLPSLAPPSIQSRAEGSPLKNVVMASPTEQNPVVALLGNPLDLQSPNLSSSTADQIPEKASPPMEVVPSPPAPVSDVVAIDVPVIGGGGEGTDKRRTPPLAQDVKSEDPAPPENQKTSPDSDPVQEVPNAEDSARVVDTPQKPASEAADEDTKMEEPPAVQDAAPEKPNEPVPEQVEPSAAAVEALPIQNTENPQTTAEPAAESNVEELDSKPEKEADPEREPQPKPQAASEIDVLGEPEPTAMDIDLPAVSEPADEQIAKTNPQYEPTQAADATGTKPTDDDEVPASVATDADDGDDLLGKLMGSLDEPTPTAEAPAAATEGETPKPEPPSKDEPSKDNSEDDGNDAKKSSEEKEEPKD